MIPCRGKVQRKSATSVLMIFSLIAGFGRQAASRTAFKDEQQKVCTERKLQLNKRARMGLIMLELNYDLCEKDLDN